MSAPRDLRELIERDGELDVLAAILELATLSAANHAQVDMATARRALALELMGRLSREAETDDLARGTCRAIVSWTADKLGESPAPLLMFSAPFQELDKPAPRSRRRTKRRTLAQRVRKAWRLIFA